MVSHVLSRFVSLSNLHKLYQSRRIYHYSRPKVMVHQKLMRDCELGHILTVLGIALSVMDSIHPSHKWNCQWQRRSYAPGSTTYKIGQVRV